MSPALAADSLPLSQQGILIFCWSLGKHCARRHISAQPTFLRNFRCAPWDSDTAIGIPQGCCSGAGQSAKEVIPQGEALNQWPPRSWCINIPTPSLLRWKFLRCVLCTIFPTELSSGCLLCSQLTHGQTFYWLPPITRFLPPLPFSELPSKLFHWSPCLTICFWENPNSDSQTSYLPSQLKQSPT